MTFTIQCPNCHVSLKANKLPPADKLIECLHCGYRFTYAESTRPRVPIAVPSRGANYGTIMVSRVLIGGVVAVALAVVGVITAYHSSRPKITMIAESPVPAERPPEAIVVAKVEPKPEPKPEPKVEPKVDLTAESNRELFTHLMIDGGIAMQLKKFDEAVDAYTRAQKLFPANIDMIAKLAEARVGLEAQEKAKREFDQQQADAAVLVKRGLAALEKEQFAAAIDFFKLALQKSPDNEEAAEQLVAAQARMQKVEGERKKLEDFDQHILSGKAAMKAGKPGDALRDFMAAARLLPNDPLPAELQKEAEKQLAPMNGNNAGDDNRKKAFQNLLDRAANALKNRRLNEAEDAFRQALKIAPTDPVALHGLDETDKAIKQARGAVNNLLAQAQTAIAGQQLNVAMNFLREAERLMPDNPDLLRALRAAELIQANQVAYFQAITQATNAMSLRLYGDAILAYTAALQIVPNDPLASVGLLEAQRKLAFQNVRQREYDLLVAQGLASIRNQRYVDARSAFQAALAIVRGPLAPDPQIERLYRYSDDMVKGYAALNARQFIAAGQFFQAALVEIPNDPAAFLGLQRAQFGNKGRPI